MADHPAQDKPSDGKPDVFALLIAAVARSFAEREPLLLLSLLLALITLIATWPVMDLFSYVLVQKDLFDVGIPDELRHQVMPLVGAWLAIVIATGALSVVWVRIVFLGRDEALGDGIGPFIRRTLGAFFRFAEYLGVLFLVIIGLIALVPLFTRYQGGEPNLLQFVVLVVAVGAILLFTLVLTVALAIAICRVATDRRGNVLQGLKLLGGVRRKVGMAMIVVYLPEIVLPLFLPGLLELLGLATEGEAPGSVAYLLISKTIDGIVTFVVLTYAGLLIQSLEARDVAREG